MSYRASTVRGFRSAPKNSLGALLWEWADKFDISVSAIARSLGCSRMTVYNWMYSGTVSRAYEAPVKEFIRKLQTR